MMVYEKIIYSRTRSSHYIESFVPVKTFGSLGISVKSPYMVVKQKACSLPDRDRYAERDDSSWSCHKKGNGLPGRLCITCHCLKGKFGPFLQR